MRVDEVLDLEEAKIFLNLRTAAADEELEGFIPAAISRVERHLDEALVDREVTETITAWDGVLYPSWSPIKEVVSAAAYGSSTTWPVEIISAVAGPPPAVTVTGGLPFSGAVVLTYIAGRTKVTGAEKLAVKMVLGEYWRTQRVEISDARSRGYMSAASGVALNVDTGPAGTAPLKVRLEEILGPPTPPRP